MKSGYFGIGIQCAKTELNWGTLFRTAQLFGADFLFLIGRRFKRQASDTMAAHHNIPTYDFTDFEDFNTHRPIGCRLIGIEMCREAIPLYEFLHPKRACYLLGAEDHGLTREAIEHCQSIVKLPGDCSMNVAVAGSIVLYDRITKKKGPGDENAK